ncbi:MAG: carbohydrate ABC transporter permease [Anaerolineales bacterium]|nr:carbohydrate ABC transporter permease [Anaerolineales bacterium]
MAHRQISLPGKIIYGIIIVVALFWVTFPFYWAFINSVKKQAETFRPTWIPVLQFTPTWEHWTSELAIPETRRALLNSTMIAVGAATLSTLLGTLAAYALARFRFTRPNNGFFTTWFLSQRIMPPVLFVIPFFLLMRQVNLLDTVLGLILLNATFTLPLPVIILSQMFRELPSELEEAARVDGASRIQAFLQVALPLVAPGLVAAWILCLAFSWNEFLFGLSLTSKSAMPMPVIIAGAEHTRGVQFHYVGVRSLLTMLPPTIMAMLAQRYIVRGLTLGAVKG